MARNRVTIYDIAREAGVSPATVSRILKGSSVVSEEKADRVSKLIRKYNFHPSAVAWSWQIPEIHITAAYITHAVTKHISVGIFPCC